LAHVFLLQAQADQDDPDFDVRMTVWSLPIEISLSHYFTDTPGGTVVRDASDARDVPRSRVPGRDAAESPVGPVSLPRVADTPVSR
jgi:hypothetical protein